MVNHAPDLDLVFHALAGTTRREILEELALAEDTCSVTELASMFDMSLPAVSKHIRVLERAGLVTRTREGRMHRMSLNAEPLEEAAGWIDGYREFWEARFDALAKLVEKKNRKGRRR